MSFKSWGLIIGIPMLIFSATAIYYLYRNDEDEYDDLKVRTSRCRTHEMKIPKETIGVLIGRGGSNIKEIEAKSDTRIKFNDESTDEEFRTCVIRGTNEAVQLAELLIHDCIMSQPLIETHEMWVPQRAVGRIIGRCGDSIKAITRASCAKVTADSLSSSSSESGERRMIIKGTAEQIAVAKSLIEEKIEEENEIRRKFDVPSVNRYPRSKQFNAISNTGANDISDENSKKHSTEKLVSLVSDGSMQVFVSAVNSPKKFWVQVISPKSVKLDHLVEQMTEYYNMPENKELHTIKELNVGQIVAASFEFDNKWYRAEVCSIKPNDYDPNSSKVSLYYVDYGDEGERNRSDLFQLRTDFLKLHFQAIECCLARVKPRDGDEWSTEATDLFEEVCQVALWRPLTARVVSYKKVEKERGEREGSPIPCVDLYDDEKEIDVGGELISKGFATPIDSLDSMPNEKLSPKRKFIHDERENLSSTSNVENSSTNVEIRHENGTDKETFKSSESNRRLPLSIESKNESDDFISVEGTATAKNYLQKSSTSNGNPTPKESSETPSGSFISNEYIVSHNPQLKS